LALASLAVVAEDRPHQGKITSIEMDAMTMVVQSENNDDQWTLYWTQSTKVKGDVVLTELKVGDSVNFEYTEKEGKMWLTTLNRTDKAETS
jgi:Cu/Ag efflux protein CusF